MSRSWTTRLAAGGGLSVVGLALLFGNPWLTKYVITSDPLPRSETFQLILGTLRFPTWAVPGVIDGLSGGLMLATALRTILIAVLVALLLRGAGRLIGIRPRGTGLFLIVWGVVVVAAAVAGLVTSPLLRAALPAGVFRALLPTLTGKPSIGFYAMGQLRAGAGYGVLVGWLPAVVAVAASRPATTPAGEAAPIQVWRRRLTRTGMTATAALVLLLGNPWLTRDLAESPSNFDGSRLLQGPRILLDALRFPDWALPGIPGRWSGFRVLATDVAALLVVVAVGAAMLVVCRSLRARSRTLSLLVTVWAVVAVAGAIGAAAGSPLLGLTLHAEGLRYAPLPYALRQAFAGATYGVLVGWVPALLVMGVAGRPLDQPLLPGFAPADDEDELPGVVRDTAPPQHQPT
ncbi:MAG: hypothetical protein M3042_11110 [Actinomycetota bacterium]|nr:hypothetical protein [Actinomycetota bacterium]